MITTVYKKGKIPMTFIFLFLERKLSCSSSTPFVGLDKDELFFVLEGNVSLNYPLVSPN